MAGRTTKLVGWVVPALALAFGLGACGGGPTKEETIADGDAICRRVGGPLASIQKPGSYQQLAQTAGSLATATDDQVTRLRRLDLPGDDTTRVQAVFAALTGVSTAAHQLQESAGRADERAAAAAASQISSSAKDAADRARAYGFDACGSSTQTAATTVVDGAKGILKTAFVFKGEAACRTAEDKVSELREPTDLRSLGRFIDAIIPVAEEVDRQLRALTIPPGDEQVVKEMLDAQAAATAKAKEVGAAAKANNARLAESLTGDVEVLQTAANAKADAYGLLACGTGVGP